VSLIIYENFYSSTEASQITGCSRRQLQYWREKSVVVPTVNPSGKGRNVYYSDSDLVALTVMEYLLSIGLSFEVCQHVWESSKLESHGCLMSLWRKKR
jgi:DNA-binding transcriptional MerR regulator